MCAHDDGELSRDFDVCHWELKDSIKIADLLLRRRMLLLLAGDSNDRGTNTLPVHFMLFEEQNQFSRDELIRNDEFESF